MLQRLYAKCFRFAVIALVFWLGQSSAWAEMGFHEVSSALVPQEIKTASESVFRLQFIDGDFEVLESLAVAEQRLVAIPGDISDLSTFTTEADLLSALQLNHCVQHQIQPCTYASRNARVSQATGFVASSSTSVWTNMQAIDGQITHFMQWCLQTEEFDTCLGKLRLRPLFISLHDIRENLVFSSRSGQLAYVSHSPDFATAYIPGRFLIENRSQLTVWDQISDFVEIKLDTELAAPLEFANEFDHLNETGYVLGFPMKTDDRMSLFGKPDAPGGEF